MKIQDGCDNFCSYCVIPLLRGRARSRAVAEIAAEARELDGKYKEIVLTGINISAYGRDVGADLSELILALKGIKSRIALGSLSPLAIINTPLLNALKQVNFQTGLFKPHFHVSLQSGSDRILALMNRKYTAAEYLSAIEDIRREFPAARITTDIIVGFPGETGADFEQTLTAVKSARFDDMHIFPFSPREGTLAAKLPQDAPTKREIRKRIEILKNYKLQCTNYKERITIKE